MNRKRHIFISILVLALTALLMVLFYGVQIRKTVVLRTQTVECEAGNTFEAKLSSVTGVKLSVDDGTFTGGEVQVEVSDESGSLLLDETFSLGDTAGWTYSGAMDLEKELKLTPGDPYTLSFAVDGVPSDRVTVSFLGDPGTMGGYYVVICVLILSLLSYCLYRFAFGVRHERLSFVLVILVLFVLSSLVTAPFSVPDESIHFSASYYLAGWLMGQGDADGVPVTESGIAHGPGGVGMEDALSFYTDFSSGNETVPAGEVTAVSIGSYPVYCYLPAAIGIMIARFLHLPWQWIILLGRFTNGVFAVLISLLAMRLLPKFRYAIAGFSLLPSCIWLYDSFSYDVWSLSLTLLFVVLILRLRERGTDIRLRDLVAPAIVLILFAPIKYVYVLLGLTIVLIPRRHWKKSTVLSIFGIVVVAAFLMLAFRGSEVVSLLTSSDMDARSSYAGDGYTSYTVGYVVRHPWYVFLVFGNTFLRYSQSFLSKALFGEVFTVLPYLVEALGFVLIFLVFACGSRGASFRKKDRVRAALIFVLGVLSVYAAFLFVYSGVPGSGIGTVEGMQGRYFLPFAPLFFVILHSDTLTAKLDARLSGRRVSTEQYLLTLLLVLNLLCQYFRFLHLATV